MPDQNDSGWHGQFSAEDVALGVNLFGELSVSRSDKRISEDVKILPWLRHTDTFAEYSLSDGNAFCGKVSVPPASG